jgi:hypothetical protein
MKKVVDTNALRSPLLETYLAASPTNIAVVTENLWVELFKGAGATNVERSLRILAEHPKQVIVLKSQVKILKIRPRQSGLQSRLVDEEQTDGFGRYCRALFTNRWTEEEARRDRERKQQIANRKYDRGRESVEAIRSAIELLKKRCSPEELKALRRKEILPTEFWFRFADDVFATAEAFARQRHPGPITGETLLYSYIFRYALCALPRAVDWIAEGGHATAAPETIVNDYTDMAYAAYATFYDGIVTRDEKLKEIHAFASRLLDRVFLKAHRMSVAKEAG